ncbi:general substrate transporter [Lophiotrema nucula]|uniref:General substrate transporter n=1 Tax=Lophiotrema nucula TaxID=690887 RepID=A0A6A5ZLK6_9PLEO|nr:general substrate transporter [Lophiotrema nucula]
MPKIYNVYFLAMVATVGGILFGFDISSMSAIVGTPQYLNYFDNPSAAGSVVGAVIAGPVSDKLGRRLALQFACLWWLVGTAVQVACNGRGMLIAGRVLNGVTVGITSSQVLVYLAEIAKHSQRGAITIIQQLAIEWGILIVYFISYGCSFIKGETASFRTAWGIQFVPCVFLMLGLPFLPESHRWLAKVDRAEEAIHVLANIQLAATSKIPMSSPTAAGWRRLILNGMWRRTMAGFTVQAWQQLSGANAMTYYVVYIFYALFIIFSTVMFFLVDKIGRRTLLVWGAIAMGFCHFVVSGTLGAHYTYIPGGVGGNANVIMSVTGPPAHTVIAFSYLLIIIYALTLAPICWVYAAEVWSLETRASGMGIASLGNWLFNFAIGLFIPPAFLNIRWKFFIVFGVLCLGGAIQFYFTYPETCGKTLEEIEVLFSKDGPHPWNTRKEIEEVRRARTKGSIDAGQIARSSIEDVVAEDNRRRLEDKDADPNV